MIEIAPGVRLRKRKISDYTPDRMNVNSGSERGQKMIVDSIQSTGSGRSIVVDKDGEVVAGNHALMGFEEAGYETVYEIETDGHAVIAHKRADLDLDDPEDPRARRQAIADNRTQEVSFTVNPAVLGEILIRDPRVVDGFYTPMELAKILGAGLGENADAVEQISDNLGVYKLDENVTFVGEGPYDLPLLLDDKFPDWTVIEKLTLWPGDDLAESYGALESADPYMYVYGTSNQKVQWERAVIGYFCYDDKLDPVWQQPGKTTARWLNAGVQAVTGVEWTLGPDLPFPVNLWQLYKTRWIMRFMQQAGLDVIPTTVGTAVNDPIGETGDWALEGIPVGCPVVIDVQASGTKKSDMEHFARTVANTMRVLKPSGVLFYGGKAGRDMAWEYMETHMQGTPYVLLPTLMDARRSKLAATKKAMGKRA